MQLPEGVLSDLRNASGKRSNLTILALVSMIIASIAGAFWGFVNYINPAPGVQCVLKQPVEPVVQPEVVQTPVPRRGFEDCIACGSG